MTTTNIPPETVYAEAKEFPQGELLVKYFLKYAKVEKAVLKVYTDSFYNMPDAFDDPKEYKAKGRSKHNSNLEILLAVIPYFEPLHDIRYDYTHSELHLCFREKDDGKNKLSLSSELESIVEGSPSFKVLREGVKAFDYIHRLKGSKEVKKDK